MRHILPQATIQDIMSERDHLLKRVGRLHGHSNDPSVHATRRNLQNRLIALNDELDKRRVIVQ